MKYYKFLVFIMALLLLVGCAPDESDRVFEDVLQQRPDLQAEQDDGAEATQENVSEGADDEPLFVSDLSGELLIFAPGSFEP